MTEEKASRKGDPGDSAQKIADSPSSADIRDLLGNTFEDSDIDRSAALAIMMRFSQKYSGPLPTAEQFRLYEESCPGAGNRILDYMDKEQSHRHTMDDRTLTALDRETKRGQFLGFAVMTGLIGVAFILALKGQPFLGGMVMLMTAAFGVVHKFIDGRSHDGKQESSEQKSRSTPPSDARPPRAPRR